MESTIAIHEGREVDVIELTNGDKIYMHRKMHGLQYRKIRTLIGRILDAQASINAETKKVESLSAKIQLGDYYDEMITIFPFLCAGVLVGEKVVPATVDYFDALPFADADTVMSLLENIVNPFLGKGGNIGGPAGMDEGEKKS